MKFIFLFLSITYSYSAAELHHLAAIVKSGRACRFLGAVNPELPAWGLPDLSKQSVQSRFFASRDSVSGGKRRPWQTSQPLLSASGRP
jgi:hypothetical protein